MGTAIARFVLLAPIAAVLLAAFMCALAIEWLGGLSGSHAWRNLREDN